MLTVVVLKMGFELVSNHEFGSVDNKEQNVGLVAFLLVDNTLYAALTYKNLSDVDKQMTDTFDSDKWRFTCLKWLWHGLYYLFQR